MIAPVRKFSVEYKKTWFQVFYIVEEVGGSITYCITGAEGKPHRAADSDVTGIKPDYD